MRSPTIRRLWDECDRGRGALAARCGEDWRSSEMVGLEGEQGSASLGAIEQALSPHHASVPEGHRPSAREILAPRRPIRTDLRTLSPLLQ